MRFLSDPFAMGIRTLFEELKQTSEQLAYNLLLEQKKVSSEVAISPNAGNQAANQQDRKKFSGTTKK